VHPHENVIAMLGDITMEFSAKPVFEIEGFEIGEE
jgi:hypothetical protein